MSDTNKDYEKLINNKDWIEKLNGASFISSTPLNYQRFSTDFYRSRTYNFIISKTISEKLDILSAKQNVNISIIFLTVLKILLYRYTSRKDIIIGIPISCCDSVEIEDETYTNIIIIRTLLEDKMSFFELIREVNKSYDEGYLNKKYPLKELINDLKVQLNENNLTLNMFMIEKSKNSCINTIRDIQLITNSNLSHASQFGFLLSIKKNNNTYSCVIRYNSILINEDFIIRLATHYKTLIKNILREPFKSISKIELLTKHELNLIHNEWNNTSNYFQNGRSITKLFEKQAVLLPKSISVMCDDKQLSYSELNKKSNQLARFLKDYGVRAEEKVGILLDYSCELIISILGVLKAGGAYVPLELSFPDNRLEFIQQDSAYKILITKKEIYRDIFVKIDKVIYLDNDACDIANESEKNIDYTLEENNLACVIYTSGSSGYPKGVMLETRSIINLINSFNTSYNVSSFDKILPLTSISSASFVGEVLPILCAGGTIVLSKKKDYLDYKKLASTIAYNGVTIISTVPSMITKLNSYTDILSQIRIILSGGESLNSRDIAEIIKATTLVNGYGLTETTICSTYYFVEESDIINRKSIPIGYPIMNTKVYIMDKNLNLMPIGCLGDIYIGGIGVARGYINNNQLTKEKFIQNPFIPGERIFKTGDIGAWMSDGNIEYHGRSDNQVKIRGFRIELSEIENVINLYDDISENAAVISENKDNLSIVSYFVSKTGKKLDIQSLRKWLGTMLPEYMIPSFFIQLEQIPVNNNGKLDKKALSKIKAKNDYEYIAPRSEIEKKMCRIFEEVLGVEHIGIKNAFFDLGGHSLKATQVINKIEAEIGIQLPLKTLFTYSTVEGLCKQIDNYLISTYKPIPEAGKKEYYPMSSSQKRMYILNKIDRNNITYNMPQGLILNGNVQTEKIKEAIEKIIKRHEILRTEFIMLNGELVQWIRENVELNFEYVESKLDSEKELFREFVKPFDLGKAPLVRVKIIRRDDDFLFFIDMHHIVSDGVSMGNFIHELSVIYNGNQLDEKVRQYKDYSEWIQTRDLKTQQEYWLNEFRGGIPLLDMPLDYMRPSEQSFEGAMIWDTIGNELGIKINDFANKNGVTTYMVYLSALMIILSKYSRQEDIVIGSPISARVHKDTEKMLGMFVNTLAMRGQPEGRKKYIKFLLEIKETCLNGYENQEYPFEDLVEAVNIKRNIARNPLFDVLLVLLNNDYSQYELNGIDIQHIRTESKVAKFDLSFYIYENNNNITVELEYCTALYKKESAIGILNHFIKILGQILEADKCLICELDEVTNEERMLILDKFNDTYTEYPKDKTIIELFENQVEKSPDNVVFVAKNGNIDKKMLSMISDRNEYEYIAPRNEIEDVLCRAFQEVLDVKQIGVKDDFFELGGHSLKAIKLEYILNQTYELITIKDILKYPIIEHLANYIATGFSIALQNNINLINNRNDMRIYDDDKKFNIRPFNDLFYKDCFYNSLFSLFSYYGIDIYKYMVDDIIHYEYRNEAGLIYSNYLENKSIYDLMKEDNVQFVTEKFYEDIIKQITSSIDSERPTIILYDPYYNSIRRDVFKKIHLDHSIVINGYNKRKGLIYAIEHNHWESLAYEQFAIPFNDIENAYYNGLKYFDYPFSYFQIIDHSSKLTGKELLINKYLKCVLKYENIIQEGICQLNKFIKKYKNEILIQEELKQNAEKYISSFNKIINSKQYEKYRIEYLFGKESELWSSIDIIIESWKKVRMCLGKYFYSGIYKSDPLIKSIDELNKISSKEVEFITIIRKLSLIKMESHDTNH